MTNIESTKNEILNLTNLLSQTVNEKIRKQINKEISIQTKNLYYLQSANNRLNYVETLKRELLQTDNELIKNLINKEIINVETKKQKQIDYDIEITIIQRDDKEIKYNQFTKLFDIFYLMPGIANDGTPLIKEIRTRFPNSNVSHLNIFDNRYNCEKKIYNYFVPFATLCYYKNYKSINIKSNSLGKEYTLTNTGGNKFILNNQINIIPEFN